MNSKEWYYRYYSDMLDRICNAYFNGIYPQQQNTTPPVPAHPAFIPNYVPAQPAQPLGPQTRPYNDIVNRLGELEKELADFEEKLRLAPPHLKNDSWLTRDIDARKYAIKELKWTLNRE